MVRAVETMFDQIDSVVLRELQCSRSVLGGWKVLKAFPSHPNIHPRARYVHRESKVGRRRRKLTQIEAPIVYLLYHFIATDNGQNWAFRTVAFGNGFA